MVKENFFYMSHVEEIFFDHEPLQPFISYTYIATSRQRIATFEKPILLDKQPLTQKRRSDDRVRSENKYAA